MARIDDKLEWVRPPQQARSQQTLERLLDAAEALFLEHGVEATSVSQVARRARSSVGAFYARFADKDALVRSVFERFIEQAEATMDSVLAPERWQHTPLKDVLQTALRFLFRVTRERHVLIASLLAHASRDASVAAWVDRLALHQAMRLYRLLDARGELPAVDDPAARVAVVGGVLLSTAEARLLRPPGSRPPLSEQVLVAELTQMVLASLAHTGADRGVE